MLVTQDCAAFAQTFLRQKHNNAFCVCVYVCVVMLHVTVNRTEIFTVAQEYFCGNFISLATIKHTQVCM
jgi:hypothetical protein